MSSLLKTGLSALAISYALTGGAIAQKQKDDQPAMQQMQKPPTIQLPMAQELVLRLPKAEIEERTASQRGGRDTVRVTVQPESLGPVSVLSNFDLHFPSTRDHKIRHMAVMAEDRFARFAFADQNGDDLFRSSARWYNVSQGVAGEVSGASFGATQIEINPGPANHTLVLTGFEFKRKDETDANVRTLGVALNGEENTISITLLDDMGPDFRGFETTIGVAALITLTPFAGPAHIGTFADGVARLNGGTLEAGGRPGRPYAFSIQYAWIPNTVISISDGARSGTQYIDVGYENGESFYSYEPPEERVALQSFYFTFMNSDHHLQQVEVDLKDDNRDWRAVQFRDSDFGDPMQWTVEFVTLKEDS